MKVTVIIVNHNTRELLNQALASLPKGIATIVVDNASADGSAELVRQTFPEVHLLENRENVGYAKAINQAVRHADGDAYLLLNSDAVLQEGAIEALTGALQGHPKAAAVGAKLLNIDGKLQPSTYPPLSLWIHVLSALKAYRWLPRDYVSRLFCGSYWDHETARAVGRISGTCLLVRRTAWEQIGPLSEEFFIYGEIHDWCERARSNGHEIWFEPKAVAIHRIAHTASQLWSENERILRVWDANYRLLAKHKGRWQTWGFALSNLVSNMLAWIKIALMGGQPAFRRKLSIEIWAHVAVLSPAVMGKPGEGGPMPQLMSFGAQRLMTIIAIKLLTLAYLVAIARVLGRGGLGIAMLVVSLVDLTSLLAAQSLPLAVTKHLADPRERQHHGAILGCSGAVLLASSLLFSSLFFIFPHRLAILYGSPEIAGLLWIGGFLVLTNLWKAFLKAWLQGYQEITQLSKLELVEAVVLMLCILLWIPLGTVLALFWALVAASTLSLFMWIIAAQRLLLQKGVTLALGDKQVWKKVLGFSIPATLCALVSWPQLLAVNTILTLRASFGAVGLFASSFQLPRNIIVFSEAFSTAYIPMVSQMEANQGARLGTMVARVRRGLAATTFPFSFLLALFSVPLIRLLYGPDFAPAWSAFIILCAAWYLRVQINAVSHYLAGTGQLGRTLIYNLWSLVVLLMLCYVLSAQYAAVGAAVAFLIAFAAYLALALWDLRKELQVKFGAALELTGVPVAFLLSCLWLSPRLGTIPGFVAALGVTTMAVLWIVRTLVNKEDEAPDRWVAERQFGGSV